MKVETIAICVLTYKRPQLLRQLLDSLLEQEESLNYTYSVYIIDNDCLRSAENVVSDFIEKYKISFNYHVEPVQNISLARNKALEVTDEDYIAFIDDDEYASKKWLSELYDVMKNSEADVVNGQMKAVFCKEPSKWISESNFFDRITYPNYSTNYLVKGSGNCLLRRSSIERTGIKFDPAYGLTGGEDTKFFDDLENKGIKFCWAANAIAYEHILSERMCLSWAIKRNVRAGNLICQMHTKDLNKKQKIKLLFKKLSFNIKYFTLLPFNLIISFFSSKQLFWTYIFEVFYKIGKLTAFLNCTYYGYI